MKPHARVRSLTKKVRLIAEALEALGEIAYAQDLRDIAFRHSPAVILSEGMRVLYKNIPATVMRVTEDGYVRLTFDPGYRTQRHQGIRQGNKSVSLLK